MDTLKLAMVAVSFPYLEKILRGDIPGVESTTAPADLKIHSIHQPIDGFGSTAEIIFYSESNRELGEGDRIPTVGSFEYTIKGPTGEKDAG